MIENITTYSKFAEANQCDLFINTIGYETRSIYQINSNFSNYSNVMTFKFNSNNSNIDKRTDTNLRNCKNKSISLIEVHYSDWKTVIKAISSSIETLQKQKSNGIELHIDYSSMPRAWYCRIAILVIKKLRNIDTAYFWYSQGIYGEYKKFPSAGVNEFILFSGKPSIEPNSDRTHIVGCGYDSLRTKAIVSVLDPSNLVACYSYPLNDAKIKQKVLSENQSVLTRSMYAFPLILNDFKLSLMKLIESTHELIINGDVIIVPDGPKPMILASSIIPIITGLKGVTCLHVSRHERFFVPIEVKATGNVYGFQFKGKPNINNGNLNEG